MPKPCEYSTGALSPCYNAKTGHVPIDAKKGCPPNVRQQCAQRISQRELNPIATGTNPVTYEMSSVDDDLVDPEETV